MPSHAPSTPAVVDYSRKWLVMAAIAMGIFLGTIDGSIVNAALPTLESEFGTNFASVQWIVLGYLLVLATLTLGVGRLGDMTGKRPIYTAGFTVFTVASVMCGLAPGVGWLIGFRIVQGIGSAMIFALGFAILTEAFPPSERGKALGLAGSIVSIGVAIGPALGGLIIDSLSWRWIFLVNLPVGIVGTWTAWRFVPDVAPPGGERFDFAGAGAFCLALLSMMLGLTMAQERGFGDPLVVGLVVVAAVAVTGFIAIERRVEHPMLDLTLFGNRLLSANLFTGWLVFVALAGFLVLAPFYLQDVLGYDTRTMGLLLAAAPISLGIVSPISGMFSDRIGPRPVLVAGLVVLVVGYLGLTTLSLDTTAARWLLLVIPVGVGIGVFQSPNNSAVMGAVPSHRLGVTSGMLTITRIIGQIVGVTVLGTLWAARVSAYSGIADPTKADPASQVHGFTDTVTVAAAALVLALGVAIWGLVTERRRAASAAPEKQTAY
ncbi:MAG: DHA2 family efflux MFS transporter permease subunit [Acidimicrobiia bacterium]